MRLSIVIVNWNTREMLRRCLLSIARNAPRFPSSDYEIIVVDNASPDQSAEMVRRDFPSLRLMANQHNAGFARANNQAIRISKGDCLLLLNPDTEIAPEAIDILADFMDKHPHAGIAGARLLNADGTLQVSCHPAPTLWREFWRLFHLDALRPVGSYNMADWNLHDPREVEVLKGACLMIRRKAIEECGLLDEDYFIYSEDQDLCQKMRRYGWKLHWVPQARVVHYGAQSTGQIEAEMFLRLYQGKVAYFRKHMGRRAADGYKLILLLASLARQALVPLTWLKRSGERQKILLLARHYRRLVRELPGF